MMYFDPDGNAPHISCLREANDYEPHWIICKMTPQGIKRQKISKAIKYIPVVNIVNDVSKGFKEKDLTGIYVTEGESKEAREGLVIDAALTIVGAGLTWLKGADKAENAVIGKMLDLNKPGAIQNGEYTVAEKLPDLGNPKVNWTQNSSVLRQEMSRGVPIRDASVNPTTGELINNTGFLKAERNLLNSHGWIYNPATQYWYLPTK